MVLDDEMGSVQLEPSSVSISNSKHNGIRNLAEGLVVTGEIVPTDLSSTCSRLDSIG